MTLCRDCHQPYHPNESCQTAAERRELWKAVDAHIEESLRSLAAISGHTPMSEVPAALRGPNWKPERPV